MQLMVFLIINDIFKLGYLLNKSKVLMAMESIENPRSGIQRMFLYDNGYLSHLTNLGQFIATEHV